MSELYTIVLKRVRAAIDFSQEAARSQQRKKKANARKRKH